MDIKLINSKFTTIKAKRNPNFSGKLEIKSNINIKSVEKVEKTEDILKIKYNFEINYLELGNITIEGLLFLKGTEENIKKIIKRQENKDYDSKELLFMMNLVMQKASIKAIQLEEELGLPIHIKLPSLSSKKE